MDKVPALVCNKRLIESLAKSGAFDSLGHRRRAVVAVHEEAVDQYVDVKRNEAMGQESLFGGLDDDTGFSGLTVVVPQLEEWDKQTLLGFEREMLGLYVSDHPLLGIEHISPRPATARSAACSPRTTVPTAAVSASAGSSPACSAR
jgi:DNA polymerase-3 subunit alpha